MKRGYLAEHSLFPDSLLLLMLHRFYSHPHLHVRFVDFFLNFLIRIL